MCRRGPGSRRRILTWGARISGRETGGVRVGGKIVAEVSGIARAAIARDLGRAALGLAVGVRPADFAVRKAALVPLAGRVLAAGFAVKAEIGFRIRAAKTAPAAKAEEIVARRATSCRA